MKRSFITGCILLSVISCHVRAQTKYKADILESKINWLGKKVFGKLTGTVRLLSGEFTISNGMIVNAGFEIDMTSIKNTDLTDESARTLLETHLKSQNFFDVAHYPKTVFVIDKPVKIEKGMTPITGNLTIKGITWPAQFNTFIVDSNNNKRVYASVTIDRKKYHLKFGSGSFIDNIEDQTVNDKFYITISLIAKKQ